jgi:hypothetical protein
VQSFRPRLESWCDAFSALICARTDADNTSWFTAVDVGSDIDQSDLQVKTNKGSAFYKGQ